MFRFFVPSECALWLVVVTWVDWRVVHVNAKNYCISEARAPYCIQPCGNVNFMVLLRFTWINYLILILNFLENPEMHSLCVFCCAISRVSTFVSLPLVTYSPAGMHDEWVVRYHMIIELLLLKQARVYIKCGALIYVLAAQAWKCFGSSIYGVWCMLLFANDSREPRRNVISSVDFCASWSM